MDAHALLTSQGWRGTGNSLHPTSNSIGLSRPLLVSKKVDNLGIGKKQHRTSDMWWMNAFDSSLKGLDTSKEGQVVQTMTSGGLDMVQKGGAKWVGSKGGLYASFVRGEVLGATLTPEESEDGSERKEGKKRKRGREGESKEERRSRKAAKKAKRAERMEELVMEESAASKKEASESKAERKARRAARRASKADKKSTTVGDTVEMEDATKSESKEERKERRRLKKLGRELRQTETEALSEKDKKKKRRKE